ncbi:MAG: sulfide/dihydroorotate dehydrogenase-like FAD/NAD-binding protein [Candidatus Omnitrophica bacterium]|nr:sulfide/dihydroorotate dehydrogenase-like FAD/NAD-binding protein [Candidatus Omnitrophota bacterium]MBU4473268.1 sulfide/dihydroorotate dehydrogenase-like FAD/NAD-binding protein [Candidatus Omnitrophota bacterium]MCG2706074.1 sulfide/dihydroorotate dehydrogenase-like FAD/NAD-binding protein [Candidatus Omnitrophota bacterium]
MSRIIHKEDLAKDIIRLEVETPQIAKKARAGQFVVIIIEEQGERIPLTLANWDKDKGVISLIFQKVGFTTRKLGALNIGDSIGHILGPLGHATDARNIGTVICIGGGVGVAEVYPVCRAFKEAGNRLIGIIGSRSKDLLILENEMRGVCDELFIATDDGSAGHKGFVTDVLEEYFKTIEQSTNTRYPDLVYAIGPLPMMRAVSEFTRRYDVKTTVSLNPIMVDATGMCGSCRCSVAGKTVFACVDGPEFDGHQADFGELEKRLELFKDQEKKIDEKFSA